MTRIYTRGAMVARPYAATSADREQVGPASLQPVLGVSLTVAR